MASQWYVRDGDEERGPISFGELTSLVRNGELTEDDVVRPAWKSAWQRADSVVGLFYMARRSAAELDVPAEPSLPAGPRPDVGVAASADGTAPESPIGLPAPEERPGWLQRLWSIAPHRLGRTPQGSPGELAPFDPAGSSPHERGAGGEGRDSSTSTDGASPPTALPPELAAFSEAPAATSAWSRTIDDALAHADQRASAAKGPRSRIGRAFAKLANPFRRLGHASRSSWLRPAFRVVCAIICANLIALAIENWSSEEALRFPSRDPKLAALRDFPLLGKCSPAEYLFLIFDAMLVTGAAAYFSARWLESRAQ